jgi:aminoglycoside phosphotransferase (APT) family kinase protein
VPDAVGLCEDDAVNGAPFLVMSYAEGTVVRDPAGAEALPAAARTQAAHSMTDALAALHLVDPEEVGLGQLGRPDAYLERQLRRWSRQVAASSTRELPALDEAHRRLVAAVPPQPRSSIVHGDYRIDNAVLGPDGSVVAILDWELCTLGDPLADVGQLAVYWTRPDDPVPGLLGSPTIVEGFPDRDELIARYAAATGLDVGQLDVYRAFGYWRIACILEGVLSRYDAGVGGGDDRDPEEYRSQVPRLAEEAVEILRKVV